MPFPKTEHEDAIVEAVLAGENISATARRFDVSRRTVHAVMDRRGLARDGNRHNREIESLRFRSRRLVNVVLRYLNRQPPSPEKDEVMQVLSELDAVASDEES
ncbi:MAG: hypothetical protein HKO53_01365 [Gemmatimonadetes bacterium]|nr:hypothetical protein [Gemmatimonadota bacterium]